MEDFFETPWKKTVLKKKHVEKTCPPAFREAEEKPLISQSLFLRSFDRLLSPLHTVFESRRQAVLRVALLLLYVLHTTAENPNARGWVIETVGTSRKNAFQLN